MGQDVGCRIGVYNRAVWCILSPTFRCHQSRWHPSLFHVSYNKYDTFTAEHPPSTIGMLKIAARRHGRWMLWDAEVLLRNLRCFYCNYTYFGLTYWLRANYTSFAASIISSTLVYFGQYWAQLRHAQISLHIFDRGFGVLKLMTALCFHLCKLCIESQGRRTTLDWHWPPCKRFTVDATCATNSSNIAHNCFNASQSTYYYNK